MKRLARLVSLGCLTAACGYGTYVAYAWSRYGRPRLPAPWDRDDLLDRFIPAYDVVERHHVLVDASPDTVLAAAIDQQLSRLPFVRSLFKARELLLGAEPDRVERPRGLLAQMTSLGWVVLAEAPGREVVVGAVTKPWEANVTFRSISPDDFAAFNEPEYVKIVWTLRADPAGPGRSVFRTETRAVATDDEARRRFRWYWSFLSPGIIAIRWFAAAHLKTEVGRDRTVAAPNRESVIQLR